MHATQIHETEECTYNQEYSWIVSEILTGNVNKTEGQLKEEAYRKVKTGNRSAYKDLCSRRSGAGWLTDVLCIWCSILVLMVVLIGIAMPFFIQFGRFMTNDIEVEEEK